MKLRTILIANLVVLAGVVAVAGRNSFPSFSQKKTVVPALRDGDILFQSMGGGKSDAIALATKCKWTHVGIAFLEAGQWTVFEAVGPVKKTPLDEWIDQGDGHYIVKRLDATAATMEPDAINKLRDSATPYLGKAYDWQFMWSDEKIYCSELVWKMYEEALDLRLCEPKALKDWNLDSDLVQRTMKERYGSAMPLDEPMVAPATLFDCPMLDHGGGALNRLAWA
ncbi:MAG: peptidoglycan peptidase [Flavobacteriales bacterium]|nr:peptidoglycan peptidase [Flavobacteriales bacterium]